MSNKAYIDQHNQYADTFGYTLKMNNLGDMVRLYTNTTVRCQFAEVLIRHKDTSLHFACSYLL